MSPTLLVRYGVLIGFFLCVPLIQSRQILYNRHHHGFGSFLRPQKRGASEISEGETPLPETAGGLPGIPNFPGFTSAPVVPTAGGAGDVQGMQTNLPEMGTDLPVGGLPSVAGVPDLSTNVPQFPGGQGSSDKVRDNSLPGVGDMLPGSQASLPEVPTSLPAVPSMPDAGGGDVQGMQTNLPEMGTDLPVGGLPSVAGVPDLSTNVPQFPGGQGPSDKVRDNSLPGVGDMLPGSQASLPEVPTSLPAVPSMPDAGGGDVQGMQTNLPEMGTDLPVGGLPSVAGVPDLSTNVPQFPGGQGSSDKVRDNSLPGVGDMLPGSQASLPEVPTSLPAVPSMPDAGGGDVQGMQTNLPEMGTDLPVGGLPSVAGVPDLSTNVPQFPGGQGPSDKVRDNSLPGVGDMLPGSQASLPEVPTSLPAVPSMPDAGGGDVQGMQTNLPEMGTDLPVGGLPSVAGVPDLSTNVPQFPGGQGSSDKVRDNSLPGVGDMLPGSQASLPEVPTSLPAVPSMPDAGGGDVQGMQTNLPEMGTDLPVGGLPSVAGVPDLSTNVPQFPGGQGSSDKVRDNSLPGVGDMLPGSQASLPEVPTSLPAVPSMPDAGGGDVQGMQTNLPEMGTDLPVGGLPSVAAVPDLSTGVPGEFPNVPQFPSRQASDLENVPEIPQVPNPQGLSNIPSLPSFPQYSSGTGKNPVELRRVRQLNPTVPGVPGLPGQPDPPSIVPSLGSTTAKPSHNVPTLPND